MLHVKHFGTIDEAKILSATYIGRLETGKNARKNGTIARKSTGRGVGSNSGRLASKRTGSALSGERKKNTVRLKPAVRKMPE